MFHLERISIPGPRRERRQENRPALPVQAGTVNRRRRNAPRVISLLLALLLFVTVHHPLLAQIDSFIRCSGGRLYRGDVSFHAIGVNSYPLELLAALGDTAHVVEK